MGTLYLIHFNRPYKHARHYLGYTEDLEGRLRAHASGNGARLMEVVTKAGIEWELVRTWENRNKEDERRIKNTGHLPHYCPICRRNRR